ncbi:class I SAM-dependent methyltransferase [Natronobeatus ordinarius]|uniref:class I SAM-dependent methyltransferase n=1 Tax=Natronobeatus ordinarius TaxID=2963433 RepID=UPI0020CDA6F2|nr:class I SAM-dependent methyltransferase [Natronobeatus ordinarius]
MIERDAVRRGYDEVADVWADERSETEGEASVLESALEPLPSSVRILDVGCGQGTPALERVGDEATVVGLDFSRRQLEGATSNVPEASFVQGDMTRLPVANDSFDVVTAFYSLIHVPSAEHRTVLEEFARVVRPSGRLLVSEGVEPWSGTNSDWLDSGAEMQWDIAGAEATRTRLREAGFTIEAEHELRGVLTEGEHWIFFDARPAG